MLMGGVAAGLVMGVSDGLGGLSLGGLGVGGLSFADPRLHLGHPLFVWRASEAGHFVCDA